MENIYRINLIVKKFYLILVAIFYFSLTSPSSAMGSSSTRATIWKMNSNCNSIPLSKTVPFVSIRNNQIELKNQKIESFENRFIHNSNSSLKLREGGYWADVTEGVSYICAFILFYIVSGVGVEGGLILPHNNNIWGNHYHGTRPCVPGYFESASESLKMTYKDHCDKNYTVYRSLSPQFEKISRKVRRDPEMIYSLDKLQYQLESGTFTAGRGARKLEGTDSVFYMRAGNAGRLYFIYPENEKGVIQIIAEFNKSFQEKTISLIKKTYK